MANLLKTASRNISKTLDGVVVAGGSLGNVIINGIKEFELDQLADMPVKAKAREADAETDLMLIEIERLELVAELKIRLAKATATK